MRPSTRLPAGLPAEITGAFASLWADYADQPPTNVRTEIRGNVVTCVLVDAVGAFEGGIGASQADDSIAETEKLTRAGYKSEAVATIVRLTRQRVRLFVSSHDGDTDVATEIFTLEPSSSRGRPSGQRGRSTISPRLLRRVRQLGRRANVADIRVIDGLESPKEDMHGIKQQEEDHDGKAQPRAQARRASAREASQEGREKAGGGRAGG
jgi:Na+-translocating membrane potential-generating system MpsC-like protein